MNCKKCGGNGYVREYVHVEGGRCYRCGGSGKESDAQKRAKERQETKKRTARYNNMTREERIAELKEFLESPQHQSTDLYDF